jgi:hypothetical protein
MGVLAARLAVAYVTLLLLDVSVARAHLGHLVQQAERYLKVDVSGYRVRLVVSLTLGARETARLMQEADADGNGWVSPEERDAYMALWGAGLHEELTVEVDGTRVPVEYAEPFMQPIGPIMATDGAVEMIGTFDLDGGEHTVVIRDGMPTDPFDRTDYSFRARDEAVLLASGISEGATEAVEHASVHRGMPLPSEFMVRVRVPERPRSLREQVMRVLPWVAGASAVLMLVLVAARIRQRARTRQAPPPAP